MANYCINYITFFSTNQQSLETLHADLQNFMKTSSDKTVYTLLKNIGYDEVADRETYSQRHYLLSYDEKIKERDNCYYFELCTESAWSPCMGGIKYLVNYYYNAEVNMVYQSEEPGCEVYVNTDVEGIFYPEKYRVSIYKSNDEWEELYFSTMKEVVTHLQTRYLMVPLSVIDTVKALNHKIQLHLESIQSGDMVTAYRFEPV